MLIVYIKFALRVLIRAPFFTAINIIGLAVGFSVFFILWPFAQSELHSDQFRKDQERIVRLAVTLHWSDNKAGNWEEITGLSPAYAASELMRGNTKEILDFTRLLSQSLFNESNSGLTPEIVIGIGSDPNNLHKGEGIVCVDKNFFDFFCLPLLSGNKNELLATPTSVALSRSNSIKFFGDINSIGKVISMNGMPFRVSGVFEDNPYNSHLQFGIAISNVRRFQAWNEKVTTWKWWPYSYLKLKDPNTSLTKILEDRREDVFDIYHKETPNLSLDLVAQKLSDVVFSENYRHEFFVPKSKMLLILLSVVSLIVLFMAWVNYVNLGASQTNSRFDEIAIRKISGARIVDVFLQFFCQAALVNLLAVLISTTLIQLIRHPLNELLNIRILPVSELSPGTILFFILFFAGGTFVMALYPTWAVSRLSAMQLLGKEKPGQPGILPAILTTFQYLAAMVLTSWIFIVYFQLDFILKKDVGLNRQQVISIEAPNDHKNLHSSDDLEKFAQRIRHIRNVENAALSSWVSGDKTVSQNFFRSIHKDVSVIVDTHVVDENFIPLYKINVIAGRNFESHDSDNVVILSKLFAERLGFKSTATAVGQEIAILLGSETWQTVKVVGIISDYRITPFYSAKYYTLSSTDRGEALFCLNNKVLPEIKANRVSIRVSTGQREKTIAQIGKEYGEIFPGTLFVWYFLDDHVKAHYKQQKIVRNQILFFTLLTVGVACLGLLAMISNRVVEKTKEIGIRKVLGTGWVHLVVILLNTTGKQFVVSILVGIPIAWKLSQHYMLNFTEQIPVQWWHYAIPISLLLFVMMGTITSVLVKAANTNPVDSLRSE